MSELAARVEALEAAVKALGGLEFGAEDGHPFYGNQWTSGSVSAAEGERAIAMLDRERRIADRIAADKANPELRHERQVAGSPSRSAGRIATDAARTAAKTTEGKPSKDSIRAKADAARGIDPYSATSYSGKDRKDAPIYEEGMRRGVVPDASTLPPPSYRYGTTMDDRASILPTNTRLNPHDPEKNEYGSKNDSYIVTYNRDTEHFRAIGGGPSREDTADPFALGRQVYLSHDQTGAKLDGNGGSVVVGHRYSDGELRGIVPDKAMPYSVFK